jgi:hypothetical protein
MSASHAYDNWNEIAVRENEGLAVSLLWSKTVDRVKVAVADARLDEQFEFDVANADALAAFYHPFAYVAGQGLAFGGATASSLSVERSAA